MAGQTTIGIDVGGTKVAGVRLEGMEVAERASEPTAKSSQGDLLDQIAALAAGLGAEASDGVGVGVPSAVEWPTGRVIADSVNVPLGAGLEIREELGKRFEVPVAVDNDATVAAIAEAQQQDGSIVRNLVLVTLGTGVGGGIICDGRPIRGATGAAGHIGHEIVTAGADSQRVAAGFPRPDSLEAIAAGPALDLLAGEALGDGSSDSRHTGLDLVEAAAAGDAAASEALERYAGRVALGVANMIHVFDPDEVVIGGGVSGAGELLLAPLVAAVEPLILPGIGTRTRIRLASHGSDAGAIGAALLARPPWRDGAL